MSCSVHDAVRLEERGVPVACVGTKPFADEAQEQSRLLGMPDVEMLFVAHPVQPLDDEEVHALADDVVDDAVEALTSSR